MSFHCGTGVTGAPGCRKSDVAEPVRRQSVFNHLKPVLSEFHGYPLWLLWYLRLYYFLFTTDSLFSSHVLKQWSPIFLAPGTSFVEDNFSMDWGEGDRGDGKWGCFGDDSSILHLLCTLFLLLLHQLCLGSSDIRSQRLEPLVLKENNITTINKVYLYIDNIYIYIYSNKYLGSAYLGGSDGRESACNAGDLGSIPGLGRSPGGGHGNPLQYSRLENPRGQRSLVGYSPWGRKELDTTERLNIHTAQHALSSRDTPVKETPERTLPSLMEGSSRADSEQGK